MGCNWEGPKTLVALLLFVANVGAQLMVISQSDGSLKLSLPPAFNASIRHHSCDAQWDVDNKTVAIITKDGITSQPPVKEATHTSVVIDSCSGNVRYFIDCLETKFRKDIVYRCGTPALTSQSPVSVNETTGSSEIRDMTPVRNRNALIIAASMFATICLVISVIIILVSWIRTQRKEVAGDSSL